MIDVWQLVIEGKFEDACIAADAEFSSSNSIFPLRNKVYALLKLHRYDAAIDLCELLIEKRNGETSSDFIHQGVARWLSYDFNGAMVSWKAAEKAMFQDAAGGVGCRLLSWYGALRTGDAKRMQQIEKWLKTKFAKARDVWPAPLAGFVCRELEEDGLVAALSDNVTLAERQWCQATFYSGLRALQDGDPQQCADWMHKSTSLPTVTWLESEHYLASGELEKLQMDPTA